MPTSKPYPADGVTCDKLGARIENLNFYLECRYIKGKSLNWVKLNDVPEKFANPKSALDVSTCKLKGFYDGNHFAGFVEDVSLMGRKSNFLYPRNNPAIGTNQAIVVPVDFSDSQGETNIKETIERNIIAYKKWVEYFSDGKLIVNFDYIDHWIRMPKETKDYNNIDQDGSSSQEDQRSIAQVYVDEITKLVDLRKYRTIFLIWPSSNYKMTVSLVPRMVDFKIKEGTHNMSLFALPTGDITASSPQPGYDTIVETPLWAFWVHEMGHDWGLHGHAPGNGWSVGIMTNQGGLSLALNAWDRFLLTWMPDELVYCDTKDKLVETTLNLSPLERADRQTKMIAIKLDEYRLLVVEAHGTGDWYNQNKKQTEFLRIPFWKSGYYSVLAYTVDTRFSLVGELPVNPDGSALRIDDGVNPFIHRSAYFLQVDGGVGSNDYRIAHSPSRADVDYASFVAVQGDSYTFEGIKITFLKTGDYETLRISRS
jgi:hypothetical protein